jgi:ubiquitin-like protein ATG12
MITPLLIGIKTHFMVVTCFVRLAFKKSASSTSRLPLHNLTPQNFQQQTTNITPLKPPIAIRMSTPSPSPTPTPSAAIPDSDFQDNDLPLTMASSMILTSLPRDAASALSEAGNFPTAKINVRFKAVGSAPALERQVCKISSTQRFEQVVAYLRKTLKVGQTDSVFLYVNSSFAPALDEVVGNLHRVGYLSPFCEQRCRRDVKADFRIVLQGLEGPTYCDLFDDSGFWMKIWNDSLLSTICYLLLADTRSIASRIPNNANIHTTKDKASEVHITQHSSHPANVQKPRAPPSELDMCAQARDRHGSWSRLYKLQSLSRFHPTHLHTS